MLKRAAIIFGAVFVLVAIFGFIPDFTQPAPDGLGGLLFGIFAVNGMHNFVHLISGIAALFVGFRSEAASRACFRIFGVIYALVALVGLFVGRGVLLGLAHNTADVMLHAIIAVAALYLGFAAKASPGERV